VAMYTCKKFFLYDLTLSHNTIRTDDGRRTDDNRAIDVYSSIAVSRQKQCGIVMRCMKFMYLYCC